MIKAPSDLQIADDRGFTNKAIESTKLFETHYPNIESLDNIQLIRVLRYFMCKAAETCIADELYGSDKERICNITYLLCDVDNEYFHINIPPHYMFELSDLSMHYLMPLKEDIAFLRSNSNSLGRDLSSALVYWQVVAYSHAHIREAYKAHGRYENNRIKTLDEIRICALKGVLQNLTSKGWQIEKLNYLLSHPWNIIGQYDGEDYMLILSTNYGSFKAGVTIEEVGKLADCAKASVDKDYSIGYILIDIKSADKQHEADRVIIIDDKMKCEIIEFPLYHKEG